MSNLVEVAVPLGLRRTFAYAVPPRLSDRIQVGTRVLVPFGRKSMPAYVVRWPASAPPDGVKIRPVTEVLDATPLIPPDLVELALWVADYYFTTPGEVIRALLPPGSEVSGVMVVRVPEKVAVLGAGGLLPAGLNSRQEELLHLLINSGPLTVDEVSKRSGIREASRWLESLEARSLVEIVPEVSRPKVREKSITGIRALPIEGESVSSLTGAQRKLWSALPPSGDSVPLQVALKAAGVGAAVAKALARAGAAAIAPVPVDRLPADLSSPAARSEVVLTPAQASALEELCRAAAETGPSRYLLHGVTGSGKTEVYLRLVRHVIDRGGSALLLVPEIGLTPMLSRIAVSHFPDQVALIHSGMSAGERLDQWRRIREGGARLVVGTRSAVFAPVRGLRVVIIDEEQDSSYKQDDAPFYHAREVAWRRLGQTGGLLVLGSATPSMETYHAARSGASTRYLGLPERIERRPLPSVTMVDMAQEVQKHGRKSVISEALRDAIAERLRRGEQGMLLLNRRGYSRQLLCRACGNVSSCRDCSVSLTFHQADSRLVCHYCGVERPVPAGCEVCGGKYIYFIGVGTEQLEEAVRSLFPDARVARLDRDSTRRRGTLRRTLMEFSEGKIDLLVGTQMLAKGHDFPRVTLVGVVAGDAGLAFPDFRSAERTFQLLTQVAGRAGRGESPGEVLIQCYYPDHYAMRYARTQDYAGFYQQEIEFRRLMGYPPFTGLVQIVVASADQLKAFQLGDRVASAVREAAEAGGSADRVRVLGPAAAPIEKLRGEYRVQIILKFPPGMAAAETVERAFSRLAEARLALKGIRIDVDPVSLL
jgi:primosomal protein N' (replication factor Y) (superfamily II helicase)